MRRSLRATRPLAKRAAPKTNTTPTARRRQAAEIEASLALYITLPLPVFSATDAIGLGALIEVGGDQPKKNAWYFLGPRAGGMELNFGGRPVLVVTPPSPLGRQLVGRRVGDPVVTPGRATKPAQRIVSVT
jgi:hypothetical protein